MTRDPDGFPFDPDPRTPADWFAEPDLEAHRPKIVLRTVARSSVPSRRVWVAAVVFGVVAVLVWRAG